MSFFSTNAVSFALKIFNMISHFIHLSFSGVDKLFRSLILIKSIASEDSGIGDSISNKVFSEQ
jgi:hypothetical protein